LSQYANLIHRNGGGGSNPALGVLQIFQANAITQSRLLSCVDIRFGLAALAVLALVLIAVTRIRYNAAPAHFRFL
jgi:DHA2 family multidrug resistance protein